MNRKLVGRVYPETHYRVTAAAAQSYARAINEDNPVFFEPGPGGALLAPPLFSAVFHPPALGKAIADPELGMDFKRALHGEQDMRFHAPIRAGDRISTSVSIESIEEKPSGETICLALESHNQDRRPVDTTLFTLFVRSRRAVAEPASLAPREVSKTLSDPMLAVTQQFDPDQTFRYAEASGDRTAIHLDDAVARKAGLPGIIGHGLCTMAFISKVFIDHFAAGEPTRLARMALRFARPVFPAQKIETRIEEAGIRESARLYRFETYNPKNESVIRAGVAEVRSEEVG